jgi:predicted metalloendopeptidase
MQLVEDLQRSTRELLQENNWVDEETTRLVTEKLEGMSVLPGFPKWASNVSSLDRFYDKVCVADVANGRIVCNCSVIIVFLLYVQLAVVSYGVSHTN